MRATALREVNVDKLVEFDEYEIVKNLKPLKAGDSIHDWTRYWHPASAEEARTISEQREKLLSEFEDRNAEF